MPSTASLTAPGFTSRADWTEDTSGILKLKVIALVDLELAVAELKVFNNHVFGLVVRFKNVSRTVIERTDHDIRIDEVHLCDLLHTSNRIL